MTSATKVAGIAISSSLRIATRSGSVSILLRRRGWRAHGSKKNDIIISGGEVATQRKDFQSEFFDAKLSKRGLIRAYSFAVAIPTPAQSTLLWL